MATSQPASPFFSLPVELRLLIYDLAIQTSQTITIGAVENVQVHEDVPHTFDGTGSGQCQGLPACLTPVFKPCYDASLLIPQAPAIDVDTLTMTRRKVYTPSTDWVAFRPAHEQLLRVNKQINTELKHHFPAVAKRCLDIYIQFPCGLYVVFLNNPGLLDLFDRARSITLAGIFVESDCPLWSGPFSDLAQYPMVQAAATQQLGELVGRFFGGSPWLHSELERLEMRIYFHYGTGHQPARNRRKLVTVIDMNRCVGRETLELWRGEQGYGQHFTLTPATATGIGFEPAAFVWRALDDDREDGLERNIRWVVDTKWPEEEE